MSGSQKQSNITQFCSKGGGGSEARARKMGDGFCPTDALAAPRLPDGDGDGDGADPTPALMQEGFAALERAADSLRACVIAQADRGRALERAHADAVREASSLKDHLQQRDGTLAELLATQDQRVSDLAKRCEEVEASARVRERQLGEECDALREQISALQAESDRAVAAADKLRSEVQESRALLMEVGQMQARVKELEEENAEFKKVSRIVTLQNENQKLKAEVATLQDAVRKKGSSSALAAQ